MKSYKQSQKGDFGRILNSFGWFELEGILYSVLENH